MSDEKHTYPSKYPIGAHWAVDEAWRILDVFKPGLIPDDVRSLLAGEIAGVIMKYAVEGPPAGTVMASRLTDHIANLASETELVLPPDHDRSGRYAAKD